MKAKQKMKKVCYLYVILIHCFFLVFFLICCFILFCSSLKRELLLIWRQRGSKKELNKRGRGTMMLMIMYFSLS
jgi:hypothetical protein